jgi:SAM-dependent methyltransferase
MTTAQQTAPHGTTDAGPGSARPPHVDHDRLQALLGSAVIDLGALPSAGLLVIGERLGLFTALADGGPQTTVTLAARTDTTERYVREWARALAAGGYISYAPDDDSFWLSPEQRLLVIPGGPLNLPVAARMWLTVVAGVEDLERSFRGGGGLGWGEQDEGVWSGTDAFYRANYEAHLVPSWLPSLDGVVTRLQAGANVADVGTGYGTAPVLIARAFPAARVVGFDNHEPSIRHARDAATEAGLGDQVSFKVADASDFPGSGYDLITTLDAFHDLGDPLAAARRIKQALAPHGSWLMVEPQAGDDVQDNLHPIGRLFYSASAFLCVPNARSQGGHGLGAQAGADALRRITAQAGFTRFRLATRTPFNNVFEIRH